jgi:hypothetical protein
VEENILQIVDDNPEVSTRAISHQVGAHHSLVHRTICDADLHPYHYTKVQALLPVDFQPRINFSNWILEQDHEIFTRILWTDEACFTRSGFYNIHNNHFWAENNPHVLMETRHQHQFSVNVWAGIVGNHLVGPFFFNDRLNADRFLNFLNHDLDNLLENIPQAVIQNMWIQLDGAPPHFTLIVRNWLDLHFPNRWIGRGGTVPWPVRSPDFNILDYFFWGYIKNIVYRTPVENVEDLRNRILAAAATVTPEMLQRARSNLFRRAEACLMANGEHFIISLDI